MASERPVGYRESAADRPARERERPRIDVRDMLPTLTLVYMLAAIVFGASYIALNPMSISWVTPSLIDPITIGIVGGAIALGGLALNLEKRMREVRTAACTRTIARKCSGNGGILSAMGRHEVIGAYGTNVTEIATGDLLKAGRVLPLADGTLRWVYPAGSEPLQPSPTTAPASPPKAKAKRSMKAGPT